MNPALNQDSVLELTGNFGRSITSVWALNFGRERGFVEEIATQGNYAYGKVVIRACYEIRLLIDIYGYA